MQLSFIKRSAAIAVAACSIAFATQALAAISLDEDSDQYIGYVEPGAPANPPAELVYINTLYPIALNGTFSGGGQNYHRSDNLCASCTDATANVSKNDVGNVNVGGGAYDWIIGKYDGQNAGSIVWYVGDLDTSGGFTLQGTFLGHALSHWATFNTSSGTTTSSTVAEPNSSSLAMLALGLLGAGFCARRKT